jgi:hypothetical protein
MSADALIVSAIIAGAVFAGLRYLYKIWRLL